MTRITARRARRTHALTALAALIALLGCRDGPAPFESTERPLSGEPPWRLTFSPGDDRGPIWSANGDSVYYSAEGFDHLPRTRGVLVRVPRSGGVAQPILADIQNPTGVRRWLTAAARSTAAGRIAYAEMWRVYDREGTLGCGTGWVCSVPDTASSIPLLGTVMCRVRTPGVPGRLEDDPVLRIDFAGRDIEETGVPPLEHLASHPFQYLYNTEGALVFRPAWAPDGERLVLSDGLRLLIWRAGDAQATPIPGTDDGVGPAWSPDGEWIAYTYLERGPSRTFTCTCPSAFGPVRLQERTVFEIRSRVLRLVRPDGSEQIDLGEGEEPAWTPDGSALVFRAADRLWRVQRDGSGLTPIPGTAGGREPAVSPDGNFLAFTRPAGDGEHDVWVITLAAQP